MNVQEYRLGTLMRCEVEIKDLIESEELHPDTVFNLQHLLLQIEKAIGDKMIPRTR